jgi:5-methylcytosine-specific restriction endonuclease McrA
MNIKKLLPLVENGKSITEMSSHFGKSHTTIRYWLKKYGLKSNWSGFFDLKYPDEELLNTANNAKNFTDCLMRVCGKTSGGAYYHYRKRLKSLGFDFSKYNVNSGGKVTARKRNKEATQRRERLVRRTLDTALRHNNVEYKCKDCGIDRWRGERLLLHIHHIDENPKNNEWTNLCYLCPNCHGVKHYDGNGKMRRLISA